MVVAREQGFQDSNGAGLPSSARDLLAILFRRKWDFAVVVGMTLLVGIVWLFFVRDAAYEVSGKVLVRPGREQAIPTTVLGERTAVLTDPQQWVNSEVALLRNRDLITKVVDHLGLDRAAPPEPPPPRFLPRLKYGVRRFSAATKALLNETLIRIGLRQRTSPRDFVIDQLYQGLMVTPQRNSGVIDVRLFLPSRQGASVVLNTLLEQYEAFRRTMLEDAGAVDFFQRRTDEAERALRQAEAELVAFEQRERATALEEQKRLLLTQIANAGAAAASARLELQEATERSARLQAELAKPEPNFASIGAFRDDPLPQRMVADLTALSRERTELGLGEFESGARTRNNRMQAEQLIGYLRSNLEADVAERRAAYDGRVRVLEGLNARLSMLQRQQTRWASLSRADQVLEEDYLFYRRKLEESAANQALTADQLDNVTIIERAVDPIRPAGARRLTLLAVIFFVAFFAAAAWVALVEFFDHRIHSPETLERDLGIPVLASIPFHGSMKPPRPRALLPGRAPVSIGGALPDARDV